MTGLSLQIGSLILDHPFILAPLAGITDLPFRLLAKQQGAALVVTEMVSAMGLCQGGKKTMKLLVSSPAEKPLSVQLFGKDPDRMAEASVIAQELGADVIDINLGCPARKVVRHGSGVSLLKDFDKVKSILEKVRRATRIPLTVKTRSGWSPGEGEILDLIPILVDCGVDALTLHPRFGVQGFSGRADWSVIAQVVEKFPGPVIGNGDLVEPRQIAAAMKAVGCAGIMIGRGALGNPWIFKQALGMLQGREVPPPDLDERFRMAADHARLMKNHLGDFVATYRLRSVLMWYTKGLPESAAFRGSINQIHEFETLMDRIREYFTSLAAFERKEAQAV